MAVRGVQDTAGVCPLSLKGQAFSLVEVELGGLGRGSWSSFSLEVVQDASDHGGLGNEGDDLHLFPALPAGQGVDLVDFVNKLGPSFSQRAPLRRRFIFSQLIRRVADTRC